jgi:hypothetical protein
MTKYLLAFALAACANSRAPAPTTPHAQPAQPPAPKTVQPPDPEIEVWARYEDYSGHGLNAVGRFYLHDAGHWVTAACESHSNGDLAVSTQAPPTGPLISTACEAFSPVDPAQVSTLDGLLRPGYKPISIKCRDQPEVCKQLGVAIMNR